MSGGLGKCPEAVTVASETHFGFGSPFGCHVGDSLRCRLNRLNNGCREPMLRGAITKSGTESGSRRRGEERGWSKYHRGKGGEENEHHSALMPDFLNSASLLGKIMLRSSYS